MSPVGGEEKNETSTKPRMHCLRNFQIEDPGHARSLRDGVSGTGENRMDKGFRESIPRQVDKKTRVPEEETGLWHSQEGGKDRHIAFLYIP